MGRIFIEHTKRNIKSLDGAWRFATDEMDIGENRNWYNGLPNSEHMSVPSVWNITRGLLNYEGAVWYEKEFYTSGGTLRFCFGAVMTEAKVWLDGEYLGDHYGGFSEFDFIASNVRAGKHILTVKADNRFDSHSIPQKWVDWYHYGGIIRSVSVETLEGMVILSNRFEYKLSEDMTRASCTAKAVIYNADSEERSEDISLCIDTKEIVCTNITLGSGMTKEAVFPTFELDDIKLWDTAQPNLYTLHFESESDDLFDRVGFRQVEVKSGELMLNKKAIEIRGVNRHEEHPEFGFAFPSSLMKRDIDIISEMGCNSIRGSHYPNSREFVDLLDECGMLFWSEIPIWGCGFSDEALADPLIVERGLEMHREMVKQYYNHPSIVIWGMHNEINSRIDAAYAMSKTYYEYLKADGGNRAVVYATCHPMGDICLEFCDIICINSYHGWYYGFEDDAWQRFLAEFKDRRNSLGMSDKPIIISEFGYGAVAGCHDDESVLWSEEYQAKQISNCLSLFHNDDAVIGAYIWQFTDVRTCLEAGISRARGFNNKGIMNEYRKPKLAYYAAQRLYREFAAKNSN